MDSIQIYALVIFIITYTGIIFTRLPWVNIDRPSAAFFGAVAMAAFGIITLEESVAAIDFNTIFLLLGMMIIVSSLQLDGFFRTVSSRIISLAGNQKKLMWLIIFITGISSAFMVNDVVVLILTPVIISVCMNNKLNPVPYLIAEILACNAGSVMSITGNPQNMLIGLHSGLSYTKFMFHLLPVALLSMLLSGWVILLVYRSHFRHAVVFTDEALSLKTDYSSMRVSVPVFIGVVILFFLSSLINIPLPLISLLGASVIMLFGKIKPSQVLREVDWVLLLFFASLFIVVHSVEKVGLMEGINRIEIRGESLGELSLLHFLSLVMSQIVSNVPYAIAALPLMKTIDSQMLWLALASSSTLAGNATIIGAVANLIVIESAKKQGVNIGFTMFLKTGLIATVLCMTLSVFLIYLQFLAGWL